MTKKKAISIALVCTVFIIAISSFTFILSSNINISTGKVLISENGTYFLIKGNTPVRLSDYSEEKNIFSDIESGDKILVIHNTIAESYPASAVCRFCIKTGKGSISDIPEEVITTMTQLGWLKNTSEEIKPSETWKEIEASTENANLFLSVPQDWEYTKSNILNSNFSISLYHSTDNENNITIEFTDSFGVCGTGLHTEETTINGYKATMGIYDGNPVFDYIVFNNTPGFYVIYNNGDTSWWQEYESELRAIFSSLRIAEGIVFRDEAIRIAEKSAIGENNQQYGEFDPDTGIWSFVFESDEKSQIIKIDKNGSIL